MEGLVDQLGYDPKEVDYLVYDYANTQTLKDTRSVNLVVAIKREFSEERWPLHSQHPTCVYLMALGGFIGPNSPAKAFTRWTDADTMRKLTDEEMKLLENDFLQNYIQENLARARAEAGV